MDIRLLQLITTILNITSSQLYELTCNNNTNKMDAIIAEYAFSCTSTKIGGNSRAHARTIEVATQTPTAHHAPPRQSKITITTLTFITGPQ